MLQSESGSPAHTWRIKRGSEAILFPSDDAADPSSWFERNKMSVLRGILTGSDDVRVSRYKAMQRLSKAHKPDFFTRHPSATKKDQVHYIDWLQQWLTITGFATRKEIAIMRLASMMNQESGILQYYKDLITSTVSDSEVLADTTTLPVRWPPGELRIALFGSFAPVTPTHLAYFSFYRMFCHMFIIGLDSDALLARRKPGLEAMYPYKTRRSVINAFPHVYDEVRSLPENFLRPNGDYNDRAITGFIRKNHINIIALNPFEPGSDRRRAQIREAGAVPFELGAVGGPTLRSSHIREFRQLGELGFGSLTK